MVGPSEKPKQTQSPSNLLQKARSEPFSHESSHNPAQPSTPDNPNAQTATKRKKSIHERDPAVVKKVNIQAVTLDNLSPMEILEVSQTKAKHPNKHYCTCSF